MRKWISVSCSGKHEQEEMCTKLSVTCGILMNLKNAKVEKNQMKTEGMKRKIVPVDKKVQKVWSKVYPVLLPYQQSN